MQLIRLTSHDSLSGLAQIQKLASNPIIWSVLRLGRPISAEFRELVEGKDLARHFRLTVIRA
jgi:hypothetical protein